MQETRIENWHITANSTPYQAPECLETFVVGKLPNGQLVRTSAIVEVSGRSVRTRSGSRYRLGNIDKGYKKWLDKNHMQYDPRNPIKTVRRS